MRKILTVIICFIMVICFTACGNSITLDEAKQIAIQHAKVAEEDVTYTEAKGETSLTGTKFEIEFVCPTGNYEYEISGNGKILSVKAETAELPSDILPSGQSSLAKDVLTESDALNIVLDDIGIKESDVTASKIHIDTEGNLYVYDIELYVGNNEYEYEINANTGDIVKCERKVSETASAAAQSGNNSSAESVLTESDALNIVLEDIGIKRSDITSSKIHLDTEDNLRVYEVDVYVGNDEYEYEVDASTGKIVKSEREIA